MPIVGRHLQYRQILRHLAFVFRRTERPPEDYFRTGVIRHPLDWLLSWFNYKARKNTGLATADQTQELVHRDLEARCARAATKPPAFRGQSAYFVAADGSLVVDYLIPMETIDRDVRELRSALGLKQRLFWRLPRRNASNPLATRQMVDISLAELVGKTFEHDLRLHRMAMERAFCDCREIVAKKRANARGQMQQ
jgi:hypothetical protein